LLLPYIGCPVPMPKAFKNAEAVSNDL